jgi:predicted nucleic-acid-binding protein
VIGLDTNVIVQLFVDDNPKQAQLARQFVASRCTRDDPGFVNRVTLCEFVWVLGSAHRYGRTKIADTIEMLMSSSDILLEDHDLVRVALQTCRISNVDFADALIGEVNRARGCQATATFDRKAAKLGGFVAVA